MKASFAVATIFVLYAWNAEAVEVVRLVGSDRGPTGKETNVTGWLLLNGANFRNAEYPELAKNLRLKYGGASGPALEAETTPLPFEPYELRPNGDVARGYAICPSTAICGDRIGEIKPFRLNSTP